MGINVQDIFAQDPELIQRRLAMQEMQQLNPTGSAAGAIGALLGRGLGNVSRGRGFFDIADPALQKVSQLQGLMKQATVDFDPANPAATYDKLSTTLSQAGYVEQAAAAAEQARKIRTQEKELGLRERGVVATERQVTATEEQNRQTMELRRDELNLKLEQEKRLGRYTDAQIAEIRDRINKGNKKIVAGRDQFGGTLFYETDEKSGTVRPITPLGTPAATASAASGLPGNLTPAQIAAELERRRQQGK
jgi:hypothetical protein